MALSAGAGICLLWLAYLFLAGSAKPDTQRSHGINSDELDVSLRSIASASLGKREGAIVVIDPQTGRMRAVVNPHLAFQSAVPPGSTIKPFTALTALRAAVIDANSRSRCRRGYKRGNRGEVCSHPLDLGPLNPSEAIAYSCNDYFTKVGERVKADDFSKTLRQFGFGQATGIDVPQEPGGSLVQARWQPESAIGEGAFLQVTPLQLLVAYSALLNGGHLLTPILGDAARPHVRSNIDITKAEREILLAGMRGAVRFGTAEEANLSSLPSYVVGKTGTSTPIVGFRPQGWFVGLAFAAESKADPSDATLGLVVYLKNAHGADAALVARSIFEDFDKRRNTRAEGLTRSRRTDETEIMVHQVSERVTRRMSLEDYILRVVATEASTEVEPEALKALAITARSYSLRNVRRHGREGYDFCSTTHCQRFGSVEKQPGSLVIAAVTDTAGLVLRDERGQIADTYFSASCGGMTANLKTLWGTEAPKYLRGVRDEYCDSGAHYQWTDVISAEELVRALRSDPKTDVGQTVQDVLVLRQDQTRRAQIVSLVGERRKTISGWDFKLILGRALGWNVLKSSLFTVSHSGSAFVFRGGGFGHGLGLCQEGSRAMAQRGFSYRQVLAKYFPGTGVTAAEKKGMRRDLKTVEERYLRSDLLWRPVTSSGHLAFASPRVGTIPALRRTKTGAHFRLNYPQTVDSKEAEQFLSYLESTRTALLRRLAAADVEVRVPNLEIFINESTGNFVGRTGLPWWAAAATKGTHIELQPLALLKQRQILETTIKHELVHVVVDTLGAGKTPRWLAEGLALFVAGEGRLLQRYVKDQSESLELLEERLGSAKTPGEMQSAYGAAYNVVRRLIQSEGEKRVWRRVFERH